MTPEKSFSGAAVSKPRQHSTCYYIGDVNYSNNYNSTFYQNIFQSFTSGMIFVAWRVHEKYEIIYSVT